MMQMKEVTSIKSANGPDITSIAPNPAEHSVTTAKHLSDHSMLQLHQRLQLTLDISVLIESFLAWVGEHHGVGDITYHGDPEHEKLNVSGMGNIRQR